uniref:Odorant-binding protein 10 n=1 Tax=Lygus lineolaris TaxID=50650 RepID=W0HHZ5_LYGLI|nr:odorant-binding protein 10 [Lygus lineolaris]
MTPIVAILFALLAAHVKANTKELSPVEVYKHKIHEECIKETKATPEQAKIVFNYKDVPKDDGEKCFMECVYKKSGGIDANGKYSIEGFNKLVDMKYKGEENAGAKMIVKDCSSKVAPKEGEKCSVGRTIRECLSAASKENEFFTI